MIGKEYIMAIDPDVDYSGVAIYHKGEGITLTKWQQPRITEFIKANHDNVCVIVEAGYLNKIPNFHGGNFKVSQKIASSVGRNWQVAYSIIDYCKYYHAEYKEQKPLQKVWRNGKISEEELNKFILAPRGIRNISNTNQDERDAILLLFSNIY